MDADVAERLEDASIGSSGFGTEVQDTPTLGIIGLGSIGKRHLNNAIKLGWRVAGYDADETIDLSPWCKSIDSIKELLLVSDAIVIASPTSAHAEHLWQCLDSDLPILLEKPVCERFDNAKALLKAAKKRKAKVMVGYNQRFNPCVIKAKKWIEENTLGNLVSGIFRCSQFNAKPSYLRDGVILNWSHEIDLAVHFFGPVDKVKSFTRLHEQHDDFVQMLLAHKSGQFSSVQLDYISRNEVRGFAVQGVKGELSVAIPGRVLMLVKASGAQLVDEQPGTQDDDYVTELSSFLAYAEGGDLVGCSLSEAVETMKICEEVRKQAGII